MKNSVLQAAMAGMSVVALYATYVTLSDGGADSQLPPVQRKQSTINKVLESLKEELRSLEMNPPRDTKDGMLTKQFML